MDRKKQLVFKYFDSVFRGYKKHGRRPATMRSPHVLFSFDSVEKNGRTAFEYDTEEEVIRFDYDDFQTTKNIFGVDESVLTDICKEYVADKLNQPSALNTTFNLWSLN
tara:strand:+ start:3020 stop:3343 length:324 start_codon:yes stop_codon:yes gene_type:complete